MDSVTQFVLGASISSVLLGPKISKRAVLLGGIVATLPDLDAFLSYDNIIDAVTYHRGFSHSLLVQSAVSPLIAGVACTIFRSERISYVLMLLTVWLCLITHSLLDSLTTYGTQLFWPLEAGPPFAFPSVFIIDPFYTLTLIIGVIGFLFLIRKNKLRAMKLMQICLALSTFYLVLGMSAHLFIKNRAEQHPELVGKKVHIQPTPFNIFYWQILAIDRTHFYTATTSVFNGCSQLDLNKYARASIPDKSVNLTLLPSSIKRFEWFAHGFHHYETTEMGLKISDLRIGFAPFFPFSYVFATASDGVYAPHLPVRAKGKKRTLSSLTTLYDMARRIPKGCW